MAGHAVVDTAHPQAAVEVNNNYFRVGAGPVGIISCWIVGAAREQPYVMNGLKTPPAAALLKAA